MKKGKYSKNIADAISSLLTEDDWNYSFDKKVGLFTFELCLTVNIKKLSYYINVMEDEYIVYAISPIGVEADDRKMMGVMAEFVCRTNYGMKNGCFELDMNDGEIRFKCYVGCNGITPTKEMIRNSILCPCAMFEQYSTAITDVIFEN